MGIIGSLWDPQCLWELTPAKIPKGKLYSLQDWSPCLLHCWERALDGRSGDPVTQVLRIPLCTLSSLMASEPGVSTQAETGRHEECLHGKGTNRWRQALRRTKPRVEKAWIQAPLHPSLPNQHWRAALYWGWIKIPQILQVVLLGLIISVVT